MKNTLPKKRFIFLINLFLFTFILYSQEIKIKHIEGASVQLSDNLTFQGLEYLGPELEYIRTSLRQTFSNEGKKEGTVKEVCLSIQEMEWPQQAQKFKERYKIEVSKNIIEVSADNVSGLVQGVSRLEFILIKNNGEITQGEYIDWPSMDYRGIRIQIQGFDSPTEMKAMLTEARRMGYNFVVFLIKGGVSLKALEGLQFGNFRPKAIPRLNYWTPEEFKEVVEFAKKNGFLVIPALKLLSHQEALLQDKYQELMYNRFTYDPSNPKTYEIIFSILDEIIDLIHPCHFNIAHDEIIGVRERKYGGLLNKNEKPLPASLFVKDVCILNNYFSQKGIQVWMYGDMLLSPKEFPNMNKAINGHRDYATVRDSIPTEINIFDWHYWEENKVFSSTSKMAEEGRFVIGVTWRKKETIYNFANFVAKNDLPGMMAFAGSLKGKYFDFIFKESAKAFWNAK